MWLFVKLLPKQRIYIIRFGGAQRAHTEAFLPKIWRPCDPNIMKSSIEISYMINDARYFILNSTGT